MVRKEERVIVCDGRATVTSALFAQKIPPDETFYANTTFLKKIFITERNISHKILAQRFVIKIYN